MSESFSLIMPDFCWQFSDQGSPDHRASDSLLQILVENLTGASGRHPPIARFLFMYYARKMAEI
jgi:hypothetical protein